MGVTNYNGGKVCTDFDTTGAVFYMPAASSTEMYNIDTHNFRISALRITAPYHQVTVPLNFST